MSIGLTSATAQCGSAPRARCGRDRGPPTRRPQIGPEPDAEVIDPLRLVGDVAERCLQRGVRLRLPSDRLISTGEGCQQFTVVWFSSADAPPGSGHPSIVTGTRTRNDCGSPPRRRASSAVMRLVRASPRPNGLNPPSSGASSISMAGMASTDRKSTRLNSSHLARSRMPSSA